MTFDAVRHATTGTLSRDDEAPAIGEADANIFDCPACRRPLATGTSRCPACRTRLVAGVRATRAMGFASVGLIVGLVLGGGVVGVVATVARPTDVAEGPGVRQGDATSGGADAGGVAAPAAVDVPASAATALRQSFLVNDRLAVDAAKLKDAVARSSAVDIARSLRALAATAAFGDRIAPDVAGWDAAGAVSADLVAAYASVGATAREGLAASLTNRAAYLRAGRSMLGVLDDLAATDAAGQALARSAGVIPAS